MAGTARFSDTDMTRNLPAAQRRLHHSHKQKLVINELEERFAAASLQHEQLVQQNTSLQLRTGVLADLIRASNAVDAAYEEAASIKAQGSQNLSDLTILSERINGYGSNVQQLAMLVADALAHPADAAKQRLLAQTVDQLLNVSIVVPQSVGPERYNALLEMYYKKAFKELQGTEEEHWHSVAASLHLTPDQAARAATASILINDRISRDGPMSFFRSVRTHAPPELDPHRPVTAAAAAATQACSAAPDHRASPDRRHPPVPKASASSGAPPYGPTTATSASGAPSSAWNAPTPGRDIKSPPCSSASGAELDDVSAGSATATAGTQGSAAAAPGAPTRGAIDADLTAATSLANLDKRMQRLTYWYHVFNMYIMTILLSPSQAAQAFVNSYPLWASGPAIVTALGEQVERQRQHQQALEEQRRARDKKQRRQVARPPPGP